MAITVSELGVSGTYHRIFRLISGGASGEPPQTVDLSSYGFNDAPFVSIVPVTGTFNAFSPFFVSADGISSQYLSLGAFSVSNVDGGVGTQADLHLMAHTIVA
jgi:hypothetical protein